MTGLTILPNYMLTLEEMVQCYPDIDHLTTIEIRSTIKSVLEKIFGKLGLILYLIQKFLKICYMEAQRIRDRPD